MAEIGFIGLGNMGGPMTANLVKAGHSVTGFDVAGAATERAAKAGVRRVKSAREAAAGLEVVITMLPASEHVRDVYLGAGEVLAAAAPGTLLIDCSTIDVATARKVARRSPAASPAPRAARSPSWSAAARRLLPVARLSSGPWARPSSMPARPATARRPRSATT